MDIAKLLTARAALDTIRGQHAVAEMEFKDAEAAMKVKKARLDEYREALAKAETEVACIATGTPRESVSRVFFWDAEKRKATEGTGGV